MASTVGKPCPIYRGLCSGRCVYFARDGGCRHPQVLRLQHAEGARQRVRSCRATIGELTRRDTRCNMTTFLCVQGTVWAGRLYQAGELVRVGTGAPRPAGDSWALLPWGGELQPEGDTVGPRGEGPQEYRYKDVDTGQRVRVLAQRGMPAAGVTVERSETPLEPARGRMDVQAVGSSAASGFILWRRHPGDPAPSAPPPSSPRASDWDPLRGERSAEGKAELERLERERRDAAFSRIMQEVREDEARARQEVSEAAAARRAADLEADRIRRERWTEIQRLAAEDEERLAREAVGSAATAAEPPAAEPAPVEAAQIEPAPANSLAADLARVLGG